MLVIFLLALTVRLFHLWQISSSPLVSILVGDARAYDAWAQQIAGGDWIGHDVFYQAPLYPYLLASIYGVVGHNVTAVRLFQALAGACGCVVLGLAGARLFSRRTGLIAGLMLAVYPPAVFHDGLIQKTSLDSLLMCLALWQISRLIDEPGHRRSWALLGLSIAALCLTRENALVFVPVILLWIALSVPLPRTDRWLVAAAFIAGVAVLLVPVATRNHLLGGGFSPTTSQFGPNFFIGNNPDADGTYRALKTGRGTAEFERVDAVAIAEQAAGRALTPGEASRYWTTRAVAFISSEPVSWGRLMIRKLGLLVNRVEAVDTDSQESYEEWSWTLKAGRIAWHFGVLFPLAVLGLWLTRDRLAAIWVVPALAVSYAATVVMFYVFARYRYPLVPFAMLFAAAGLTTLPSWLRSPVASLSRRTALLTTFAAAVLVANWPLLSHGAMQAAGENSLGAALQSEGRTAEAVDRFRRAITLDPQEPAAYVNLGVALQSLGRRDEATDSFRQAVALRPGMGEARYFLGKALIDAGRTADGIDQLRQAVAVMPDDIDVRTALGIALASRNQLAEAIAMFRDVLSRNPSSARASWNLGAALASAGDYRNAIPYLTDAVRQEPANTEARIDLADAHNRLGIGLAADGSLLEATGEFQEALRLEPGFSDAQQNLATATRMLAATRLPAAARPPTPRQ